MLLAYGMSIVGSSHIEKNVPCQDSHRYELLSNGWLAIAVADGVGSAKHSEIASKMACDVFIETCKTCITQETEPTELKSIIQKAYISADRKIKDYVCTINDNITDYDTTLSTVIYDGTHIVYGHSGDGGIVILTTSGDYVKVTKPQKANDGICVIPLRAGETHWEFGECEADVASVLLATDGVYDNFMPYLLRDQPVELYVPLIRWFMDNNVIGITSENQEQVRESRQGFLCGESCKSITDDKTVVVAFNADIVPALKEDSYYAEPDWAKLQDIWNRKAYPHLYKKNTVVESSEQVSEEIPKATVPETSVVQQEAPLAQTDVRDIEKEEENREIPPETTQQATFTNQKVEEIKATDSVECIRANEEKSPNTVDKKSKFYSLIKRASRLINCNRGKQK